MSDLSNILKDLETVKIKGEKYFYLSHLLKYSQLSRQAIQYRIKNNSGSISKYIKKVEYVSSGKTYFRLFILASAVETLPEFSSVGLNTEMIDNFILKYYRLVEEVGERMEKEGVSKATEKQLWGDMPLIDSDIVGEAFFIYRKTHNEELPLDAHRLIKKGVYHHTFSSFEICSVCISAVTNMYKNLVEEE